MPTRLLTLCAVSALAASMAASAYAAKKPARPDLAVTAVSIPPAAANTVEVTDTTAVRGPAKPSTTRYYLSADKKRSRGDILLPGGRTVAARGSTGTASVGVPASARTGSYVVLACADDRRQVRERNERNNCRASASRLTLVQPFRPSPRNVSEQLDGGRAVTQAVDSEGGSISATAADGTRFTLTIPKDALLGEVEITLIPVASIAELGDRLVAAVELEPHGLGLYRPVTLVIEPATPVPLPEQATFAAAEGGKDFHLYPPRPERERIALELFHFSTYGVWRTTQDERDAQAQRVPTDREAWAQQNVVRAVLAQRAGTGSQAQTASAMEAGLFVWGTEGVRPLLERAVKNDLLLDQAAREYAQWERQRQLVGIGEEAGALGRLAEELRQLWLKAFQKALGKSFERCQRDPYEAQTLLGLQRQAQLLGAADEERDAFDELRRCARFELTFDTVQVTTAPAGGSTSHVRVERLEITVASPPSSKQLDYLTWQVTGGACTHAGGVTLGREFEVSRLDLDLGRPKGSTRPRQIFLDIYPGHPTETVIGDDCHGHQIPYEGNFYFAAFIVLHESELLPNGLVRIGNWQQLAGSVWAVEKRYEQTLPIDKVTLTETTTFTLRHAPLP